MNSILKKIEGLNLYNQSNIIRFSGKNYIVGENIAEHQCFVSQILVFLLDYFEINKPEIENILIRKALFHDYDEIYTNDISYSIKKEYPEIKVILNKIIAEKNPIFVNDIVSKTTDYDIFLKLADILDVYLYTKREIILGNRDIEIRAIYENSMERINFTLSKIEDDGLFKQV